MHIKDSQVALSGALCDALEDELARSRNFQQVQIFRGRADEDQVVVLRVVERKKATPLDAKIAVQLTKYLVETVDCNHLADTRVMIPNHVLWVTGGMVIAHAGFGPANESRVAEDHPRLFGAGEK